MKFFTSFIIAFCLEVASAFITIQTNRNVPNGVQKLGDILEIGLHDYKQQIYNNYGKKLCPIWKESNE